MNEFGDFIRNQRERLGYSQERAAKLAGITGGGLSKIENGYRDIKVSTLIGLSSALRVSLPHLLLIWQGKPVNEPLEMPEEGLLIKLQKLVEEEAQMRGKQAKL